MSIYESKTEYEEINWGIKIRISLEKNKNKLFDLSCNILFKTIIGYNYN